MVNKKPKNETSTSAEHRKKSLKKGEPTARLKSANGRKRQSQALDKNATTLHSLLEAFWRQEPSAAVFVNALSKYDLGTMGFEKGASRSETVPHVLFLLCGIDDKNLNHQTEQLIKKLCTREDRAVFINRKFKGKSPLQHLVENRGDLTAAQFDKLVQIGFNINCSDDNRRDLLYSAVKAGNFRLAKHLIDAKGFDPNKRFIHGEGMMSEMACHPFTQETKRFLDELWTDGKLVLQEARIHHDRTGSYMQLMHTNYDPLTSAIRNQNGGYIQWLVDHDAKFNLVDNDFTWMLFNRNGLKEKGSEQEQELHASIVALQEKIVSLKRKFWFSSNGKKLAIQELTDKKIELALEAYDHFAKAFVKYHFSARNVTDVTELCDQCTNVLKDEKYQVLNQHRGWSRVWKNIGIHLALLATTFGIGNIAALGYNYRRSKGKTLFFEGTTDSKAKIDTIEDAVKKINHKPK